MALRSVDKRCRFLHLVVVVALIVGRAFAVASARAEKAAAAETDDYEYNTRVNGYRST